MAATALAIANLDCATTVRRRRVPGTPDPPYGAAHEHELATVAAMHNRVICALRLQNAYLAGRLSFPAGILNFESSCGVCDG